MAPLIGIAANMEGAEGAGAERYFAGGRYVDAVVEAGGIPLILPIIRGRAAIKRQVQAVAGILLIGGYDVDPLIFGEEPHADLGPVFPERDEYELAVAGEAKGQQKPILGICRGLQVINIAFGGTLYQDLSQIPGPVLQHRQPSRGHVAGHTAEVVAGTMLERIFAARELRTNSHHHQAVKAVAPDFAVNARTRDGVVEGIENEPENILGVQWHPEMMFRHFPEMLSVFRWLVEAAGRKK
ncbi:MAG TPA: gamma-glutamyl-gamma-aminobutyrate hydrolase family protein [Selenomonadales bacterium]|nr:gamma-glutamyl-gamma-aminobutyrate hydrolase family protein [Selenomonadales bacterium]